MNLKRGCTEFGNLYPDFKKVENSNNNLMKYNNKWREKENIIDDRLPKKNRINQRVLNDTISGFTLNDFLIMRNWVMYAKMIEDEDYNKFDNNIVVSDYIKNKLAPQLNFRKKEFKDNLPK